MRIQAFIFSWTGHEARAAALEAALAPLVQRVSVINSEEGLEAVHPEWIHLGEQAYFSAQWNEALARFDGDLLLHIQADAWCDDFPGLVRRALDLFQRRPVGILEPKVDFTDFEYDARRLRPVEPGLAEVPLTDCTCWFIEASILRAFRPVDLSLNRFGWGICAVMAALCLQRGRLCLRDFSLRVHHPRRRGYSSWAATQERAAYFATLEPPLAMQALKLYDWMQAVKAPG